VSSYDIVVIGAGIVGAACAAELACQGLRVGVVEQGVVGGGATSAGMGHLVVMDDSEAQFALTRGSQKLWQQLADELPPEVEYDSCGTIWVAADEAEMDEAKRKKIFYEARGVRAELLDERSLRDAEPNLRPGLAGGLLVPEDAVIYPPCAARFLFERAKSRGAELDQGRAVTRVTRDGVTLEDGTSLTAGRVVNATGCWAPQLTPGIEVNKRKGHLVITDRYPGFVRHQLVELGYLKSAHSVSSDSVAFNVQPRKTGQILVGSSRQYGAEESRVEHGMMARMLCRAFEYLPGLRKLSAIRSWTGFRAATPDKLPLIGPCADQPWLYLATGHEGLGITTSLGTASLVASMIAGGRCEIPAEPYLPSRVAKEPAHA